jgi:signal transduction histidine kinase
MTVNEVNSLRGFTSGLKDPGGPAGGFLPAVRRFAAQFADNYNLEVQVEGEPDINVNDRLAAELIQIVQEGLSNVRKHTGATTSKISLGRANGFLQLCIENNEAGSENIALDQFVPRSITERTEELGGRVDVERRHDRTVVQVKIPL